MYKRQVHVLRKVVGIVEVDQALIVCLDDLRVQQQAGGQVFGDLTSHIVTLDAVHGGVLVGVLLLDFLVLALDQAEDALVGGCLLYTSNTTAASIRVLSPLIWWM